jgi:hypothetical protein
VSLIAKRPWVALVVVAAALAVVTDGFAQIRDEPAAPAPGWLIVLALGLMVAAALIAFLFPRTVKGGQKRKSANDARWKIVYVQWVSAIAIYMYALLAWGFFGAPDWLLIAGGFGSGVVLLILITTNRHSYKVQAERNAS